MTKGDTDLPLLTAEEADSRGKGAPLARGEGWLRVRGVDHAIDDVGVAAAGDVVETSAQSPIVVEEVEFLFELHVQREVKRIALGADLPLNVQLIGELCEGKAGPGFGGISKFELVKDREAEEGKISPGEKTIGSVPRVRARLLRA